MLTPPTTRDASASIQPDPALSLCGGTVSPHAALCGVEMSDGVELVDTDLTPSEHNREHSRRTPLRRSRHARVTTRVRSTDNSHRRFLKASVYFDGVGVFSRRFAPDTTPPSEHELRPRHYPGFTARS